MTIDELSSTLLLSSFVLLIAVVAVRFATRTGMPSLIVYLGIGVVLGNGLGMRLTDYSLATVLGYCGLVAILAEGGLSTSWSSIRGTVAPAGLLATLGTVVSVLVTGAVTHSLLHIGWTQAFLLGAVVSSTDAAAVFSVLRRVPIPRRLSGMLEAESGFNDAPVVILVVALAQKLDGVDSLPLGLLFALALVELVGGAIVGAVVGLCGAWLMRAVALPAVGLYPLTAISLTAFAYGLGASLHLSGFLAVYVCALVVGNSDVPHRQNVRGFAEGVGWLAQIGLFVMLGMLVSPGAVAAQIVPALIVGATLLLLARPLSVLSSVTWFGFGLRDQIFLSWAGLRGAVPVVLATIPASLNAAGTSGLLEAVFLMVCIFTLVQAPTLPWVARRLSLAEDQPRALDVDISPLGAFDAHLMKVSVGPASLLHGLEVLELRLPSQAKITLVVRDGESFVPAPTTRLRRGDHLLLVTTESARRITEVRLQAVSEGGRLARWHGWTPSEAEGKAAWWRARRQRAAQRLAALPGKISGNRNHQAPPQR